MQIDGKEFMVRGTVPRITCLAAEGFEFVRDPDATITALRREGVRADLFTFQETLPHTQPRYAYPMEWDNVAALAVSSYEHWWTKQIDGKTRNMVRRAEKKGLVVREAAFDEHFVRGIWQLYNECPIRQGRRFPHY